MFVTAGVRKPSQEGTSTSYRISGSVSARRVTAECDPIGIDAALGRMFEQPTHDELTFLDLNWPLVLGRQLIIHAVDLGAAAFGEETNCGLELIQ